MKGSARNGSWGDVLSKDHILYIYPAVDAESTIITGEPNFIAQYITKVSRTWPSVSFPFIISTHTSQIDVLSIISGKIMHKLGCVYHCVARRALRLLISSKNR